ncbi:MAG: cobaltochelatase CobT, partial [Alphaproteobacteria bacterium]|nr:cobaltochelatase CobT [Alphaproteobacteria bacterium]
QDTAVTLLVDCSGSMRYSKLQLAAHAAYALSQTLERVGIAHEILGFTTNETKVDNHRMMEDIGKEQDALGRPFSRFSPITMYVFKAFDERLNVVTRRRLIGAAGSSEGRGSPDYFPHQVATRANVDGESVMLAALRLLKRREQRKVMIVLSDGEPAAYGIEHHLAEHLQKTVQVIEKMGVEAVGIEIRDESVKAFYKKAVVIEDIDTLPAAVMGEIKRFLIDKRP